MHKLGEVKSPEAVALISARLWKADIPHQVVTRAAEQDSFSEIWLVRESDAALAIEILNSPELDKKSTPTGVSPLVASLSYAKVTWFFLIVCLFVSILTAAGGNIELVALFTIVPLEIQGDRLYARSLAWVLDQGEYWRLFSPALIHFGGFHLVFNALWLWEFGRRIEQIDGKLRLLILVIGAGIAANLAQYFFSSPLFGGMSGVIYALLGYMVVIDKLSAKPKFLLPTGIVVFMLVWLALGFTQFTEWLGLGSIANAAHSVGLLSGVAIALLTKLLFRR